MKFEHLLMNVGLLVGGEVWGVEARFEGLTAAGEVAAFQFMPAVLGNHFRSGRDGAFEQGAKRGCNETSSS